MLRVFGDVMCRRFVFAVTLIVLCFILYISQNFVKFLYFYVTSYINYFVF